MLLIILNQIKEHIKEIVEKKASYDVHYPRNVHNGSLYFKPPVPPLQEDHCYK